MTGQTTVADVPAQCHAGHASHPGYMPLTSSGLGRDTLTLDLEALTGDAVLVAIAGANGRGKST